MYRSKNYKGKIYLITLENSDLSGIVSQFRNAEKTLGDSKHPGLAGLHLPILL